MKISATNNINIKQNKSLNYKNNIPFKGGVDCLVNFWQFVDNGGRALQFTVEDMFGTNFPRTYKGAMAGYKYTGKINVPALLQEAIREFLTGPIMCITPVAVLAMAKKSGKTVNTHIENIENLSYLMKQAVQSKNSIGQDDFLRTVIKDLITKTSAKEANSEDVEELLKAINKYVNEANILNNKELLKKTGKKTAKANIATAMENLQNVFESIIKRTKENYKNTDFTQVKYTINESGKQGSTSFKNYIEYINSYIQDFTKRYSKDGIINATQDNISKFKSSFMGKRILTFASMFAITGILMSFIPKVYTLASGRINPNATAIYKEADKNKQENEINKNKQENEVKSDSAK